MQLTHKREIVLLLAFMLMIIAPLAGQDYRLQSNRYGTAGLSFEWWKADQDQITSFAVPVSFIYPVNPKMRFYAITSPSFNALNTGATSHLNGLSDIKWGGHYLILDDQYLLTFGMNLPVGKTGLTLEEYSVASVLTMSAFNFRTPSLGQGLDLQAGISSAREIGDYILGYGASYLLKGGFEPLNFYDGKYIPGDELTLTLGADFGSVMADVLYTIYFTDQWDDASGKEDVFQSGNRLLLQVSWTKQIQGYSMVLLVRDRIKAKNKLSTGTELETEAKNSNANQFEIRNDWYKPYGQGSRIKMSLNHRLYSDNDYQTGGANLFGLGGGFDKAITSAITFNMDFKFFFGKIKTGSQAVNTTGINLLGGVQVVL